MKLSTLVIFLFVATTINAQTDRLAFTDSLFASTPDLLIQTTLSDSILFKPFVKLLGYVDYSESITINKNRTFKSKAGCHLDSGMWSLDTVQQVLIFQQWNKETQFYHLIKYRNIFYIIPPDKLVGFVNRFKTVVEKVRNVRPFQIETGGKFYTWEHLVEADLAQQNYTTLYLEE